jgi:mono/diheme cytochrome c family protein
MKTRWMGWFLVLALLTGAASACAPMPEGTAPPSPPVPKGTLVPLPTMALAPEAAINATRPSAPTPSDDAEPSPTPPAPETPTPQTIDIPAPHVVINPTLRPEAIDTPTPRPEDEGPDVTPSAPGAGGEEGEAPERIAQGEAIFGNACATCHGASGQGAANFPALAGNDFVTGEPAQVIQVVLHGRNAMPAFENQLSELEIAAVISFIRNSWGNDAGPVTPEEVVSERS